MLTFGGWSGVEHLADLHRYDGWADAWTELLPAPASGPAARAGHAAAWDPDSMSMFVFAGVQNSSGMLSYDRTIHKYSPLKNAWSSVQNGESPPARADHAMLLDPSSTTLFTFGGYNSSYLRGSSPIMP